MTKLTEHTVLARTRAQDLKSVRKLNAWGSELTDVSIVKKLPNVEVLSLSVNCISTLEDFSHCNNLQELYIRKNNITELGEIRHLRDLPKLRNLWLADNPCAESDDYRLTVIRALPQLQKLDNMPIRPDEIESAKKHGSPLELLIPPEPSEICNVPNAQQVPTQNSVTYEETQTTVTHTESFTIENSAFTPTSPNNGGGDAFHTAKNNIKPEMNLPNNSFQDKMSPEYAYPASDKDENMAQSTELSPNVPTNASFAARSQEGGFENHFGHEDTTPETPSYTPSKEHFSPKCTFNSPCSTRMPARCERPNTIRMLPKGGKSRAANILSAVLCLIKELDWASLEVVDTAIHCQMEELEEQISS